MTVLAASHQKICVLYSNKMSQLKLVLGSLGGVIMNHCRDNEIRVKQYKPCFVPLYEHIQGSLSHSQRQQSPRDANFTPVPQLDDTHLFCRTVHT